MSGPPPPASAHGCSADQPSVLSLLRALEESLGANFAPRTSLRPDSLRIPASTAPAPVDTFAAHLLTPVRQTPSLAIDALLSPHGPHRLQADSETLVESRLAMVSFALRSFASAQTTPAAAAAAAAAPSMQGLAAGSGLKTATAGMLAADALERAVGVVLASGAGGVGGGSEGQTTTGLQRPRAVLSLLLALAGSAHAPRATHAPATSTAAPASEGVYGMPSLLPLDEMERNDVPTLASANVNDGDDIILLSDALAGLAPPTAAAAASVATSFTDSKIDVASAYPEDCADDEPLPEISLPLFTPPCLVTGTVPPGRSRPELAHTAGWQQLSKGQDELSAFLSGPAFASPAAVPTVTDPSLPPTLTDSSLPPTVTTGETLMNAPPAVVAAAAEAVATVLPGLMAQWRCPPASPPSLPCEQDSTRNNSAEFRPSEEAREWARALYGAFSAGTPLASGELSSYPPEVAAATAMLSRLRRWAGAVAAAAAAGGDACPVRAASQKSSTGISTVSLVVDDALLRRNMEGVGIVAEAVAHEVLVLTADIADAACRTLTPLLAAETHTVSQREPTLSSAVAQLRLPPFSLAAAAAAAAVNSLSPAAKTGAGAGTLAGVTAALAPVLAAARALAPLFTPGANAAVLDVGAECVLWGRELLMHLHALAANEDATWSGEACTCDAPANKDASGAAGIPCTSPLPALPALPEQPLLDPRRLRRRLFAAAAAPVVRSLVHWTLTGRMPVATATELGLESAEKVLREGSLSPFLSDATLASMRHAAECARWLGELDPAAVADAAEAAEAAFAGNETDFTRTETASLPARAAAAVAAISLTPSTCARHRHSWAAAVSSALDAALLPAAAAVSAAAVRALLHSGRNQLGLREAVRRLRVLALGENVSRFDSVEEDVYSLCTRLPLLTLMLSANPVDAPDTCVRARACARAHARVCSQSQALRRCLAASAHAQARARQASKEAEARLGRARAELAHARAKAHAPAQVTVGATVGTRASPDAPPLVPESLLLSSVPRAARWAHAAAATAASVPKTAWARVREMADLAEEKMTKALATNAGATSLLALSRALDVYIADISSVADHLDSIAPLLSLSTAVSASAARVSDCVLALSRAPSAAAAVADVSSNGQKLLHGAPTLLHPQMAAVTDAPVAGAAADVVTVARARALHLHTALAAELAKEGDANSLERAAARVVPVFFSDPAPTTQAGDAPPLPLRWAVEAGLLVDLGVLLGTKPDTSPVPMRVLVAPDQLWPELVQAVAGGMHSETLLRRELNSQHDKGVQTHCNGSFAAWWTNSYASDDRDSI